MSNACGSGAPAGEDIIRINPFGISQMGCATFERNSIGGGTDDDEIIVLDEEVVFAVG